MKLTENFIRESIINTEEKEIVEFGLARIKDLIAGLSITFFIGICFGIPLESLIFWVFSMPLRTNAGGYHADSRTGCTFISVLTIIVCFYCISNSIWKEVPSFIACLLFGGLIFKISPVQNKVKEPVSYTHLDVYKRQGEVSLEQLQGLLEQLNAAQQV